MPNEQRIRQMIKEEILKSGNSNRFNVNSVPQIRDSQLNVSSNPSSIISYIGSFDVLGNTFILPRGWSAVSAGPSTTITHNLNTTLYTCVAAAENPGGTPAVATISNFPNLVTIGWVDPATGTPVASAFNFVLTQVNNKSGSFPAYFVNS